MDADPERKGTMTARKKLWIGVAVLVLLSPLGVIVPALLGSGGAWGEWGLDKIERIAGYLPEGMKRLAERRHAPMAGYALPGQGRGLFGEAMGYLATALIGAGIAAAAGWLLARVLSRRKKTGKGNEKNSSGTAER